MSGNPLDGAFDDMPNRPHVPALSQRDLIEIDGEARMQDLRIAEVLGYADPKKVRQVIRRHEAEICSHGVLAQFEPKPTSGSQGGRPERIFALNEAQSLLVAMFSRTAQAATVRAQIIEVFLAWRHGKLAPQQPPATSREVTVTGLDPEALGQVGGVFRNVVRKRDAELLAEINRSFQARVFGYIEQSLPLLDDYITGLVSDAVEKSIGRQSGIDPIVRAVEQRMAERATKDEEPLVLAPMATYRSTRSQANVETVPRSLPRMDLRLFRKMRGWSCQVVAEKVGATASAVSKHERGCCMPSAWLITRYTKISGGRLNADTFFETYRARRVKLGTWPVSGEHLNIEGEV